MRDRLADDVQVLVDRLAAHVQQSVAVDDPAGTLIAFSRHYGDEDGYRIKLVLERDTPPRYRRFFAPYVDLLMSGAESGPVAVPADRELQIDGRVGYAVPFEGRTLAMLWFIDRGRPLPHDTIKEYCTAMGELLAVRQQRDITPDLTSDTIRRLLQGEHALTDSVSLWLTESHTMFMVVSFYYDNPRTNPPFHLLPRSVEGHDLVPLCMTTLDGLHVVVYAFPHADTTEDYSRLVGSAVKQALGQSRVLFGAGVSEPGDHRELRKLYLHSALTAFIARHLHRKPLPLHAISTLGLVSQIAEGDHASHSPYSGSLAKLLNAPHGFAFDTIGAFLHSDGHMARIADSLHIHRTTLHYRINQIRDVTGLDIQAPADMFIATIVWLRFAANRAGLTHLLHEYRREQIPVAN